MKLTGVLKDKVDAVETKEEKRAIIAEAGIELTDDELEGVAGGAKRDRATAVQYNKELQKPTKKR